MIPNETEGNEFICRDKYTGERVKYVRAICKCGCSVYFLQNKPLICRYCGRTIYPTRRTEFKDKVNKLIRRRKYYE